MGYAPMPRERGGKSGRFVLLLVMVLPMLAQERSDRQESAGGRGNAYLSSLCEAIYELQRITPDLLHQHRPHHQAEAIPKVATAN